MSFEFTIPGDPVAAMSPNLRLHYLARHRLAQEWQGRSWRAWDQAGRPRCPAKARITFLVRRGRVVDPDNAAAAMKALVDGLKDQPGRPAMLADDSAAHVEFGPIAFETGAWWRPRAEVIVKVEAAS